MRNHINNNQKNKNNNRHNSNNNRQVVFHSIYHNNNKNKNNNSHHYRFNFNLLKVKYNMKKNMEKNRCQNPNKHIVCILKNQNHNQVIIDMEMMMTYQQQIVK